MYTYICTDTHRHAHTNTLSPSLNSEHICIIFSHTWLNLASVTVNCETWFPCCSCNSETRATKWWKYVGYTRPPTNWGGYGTKEWVFNLNHSDCWCLEDLYGYRSMGFIASSYLFSHYWIKWIFSAWLAFSCLLKRTKRVLQKDMIAISLPTPTPPVPSSQWHGLRVLLVAVPTRVRDHAHPSHGRHQDMPIRLYKSSYLLQASQMT